MSESPSKRRGLGLWFWCTVVLLAMGMYVGAYFAFGTRLYSRSWNGRPLFMPWSDTPRVDAVLREVFEPAHAIDELIRPQYWDGSDQPMP